MILYLLMFSEIHKLPKKLPLKEKLLYSKILMKKEMILLENALKKNYLNGSTLFHSQLLWNLIEELLEKYFNKKVPLSFYSMKTLKVTKPSLRLSEMPLKP